MRSRLGRLALGIGLAIAPQAFAENAFQALLTGSDEFPAPGMNRGGFVAVLTVDGTAVTLTLTSYDAGGWLSPHLHRGRAGVTGRVVLAFPASEERAATRMWSGSVSENDAAEIAGFPERFYLDVHTRDFPGGAARGQLAARAPEEPLLAFPESLRRSRLVDAPRPAYPGVLPDPLLAPPAPAAAPGPAPDAASVDPRPFLAAPREVPEPRVPKKRQRIRGSAPSFKTWTDADFPLEITATSGLDVVFFAWGDCTIYGPSVHLTGAGTCTFTAHQPGDGSFLAARIVDYQFPIHRAEQEISLTDFGGLYWGPAVLDLAASASSGLPVELRADGACTLVDGRLLRLVSSGTCRVTAAQPGNRNFDPAPSVERTFEVKFPPPPRPEA